MADEGKKRGTRSKRAIVVDSLAELIRNELNEALGYIPGAAERAQGEALVEVMQVSSLAETVAKGLVLNAWDLDHHPVADRFTVIWDVPE